MCKLENAVCTAIDSALAMTKRHRPLDAELAEVAASTRHPAFHS